MFSVSDSVNHLLWSSWKDTVTCLGEVDSSQQRRKAAASVKVESLPTSMKRS